MLVLLVMVLTTATFIKSGVIPVDLPDAKNSEKNQKEKELHVSVDKQGNLYIEKERVGAKELEKRLAAIPRDRTIVLSSDKAARFQDFVTVMDILKKLKHKELYIVTKE